MTTVHNEDLAYDREVEAIDAALANVDAKDVRDATHFRRIIAARRAIAAADDELLEAVRAARSAGDSWTIIGAAMGTSRQGAQRRFGHALGED